jgi:hypothetical protein
MTQSIYKCLDCGETLHLSWSVTVHDNDPDNSHLEFCCTGRCRKEEEQSSGLPLLGGILKHVIWPKLQGLTFGEKQDVLLELARGYVIDDNAIVARQKVIAEYLSNRTILQCQDDR